MCSQNLNLFWWPNSKDWSGRRNAPAVARKGVAQLADVIQRRASHSADRLGALDWAEKTYRWLILLTNDQETAIHHHQEAAHKHQPEAKCQFIDHLNSFIHNLKAATEEIETWLLLEQDIPMVLGTDTPAFQFYLRWRQVRQYFARQNATVNSDIDAMIQAIRDLLSEEPPPASDMELTGLTDEQVITAKHEATTVRKSWSDKLLHLRKQLGIQPPARGGARNGSPSGADLLAYAEMAEAISAVEMRERVHAEALRYLEYEMDNRMEILAGQALDNQPIRCD
ncbi:hypothetical protein QBC41DRAFT_342937 [Cercophora samala]|uniref:Uncharacterized protein n=1 Tax=Cercophora samala TaxID=330535 RepID=A0AA39ZLP4_9PEZI|nr:hypothetical protein QBC41DRAFT_342937 [Cercophora samala]